jgi:hypothetical protein
VNKNDGSHETLIGVGLLVGLLLVALVMSLIAGIEWYLNPASKLSIVERRNLVQGLASAGQALAVFLTGAVGLIGLFFTWQNTIQARKSTQRTLELTEQGQITDRFTRAVELLGETGNENKILEARLGAIYALARIAREVDDYYWPIMEILAAYIRHNAAIVSEELPEYEFWIGHADPDIQAIVDIFGQRATGRSYGEHGERIVLTSTNLRNASFLTGNFRGIWFWKADLRGANFAGSDVREAIFRHADLRRTHFQDVKDLTGAVFNDANLEGTRFYGVHLAKVKGLTQDQIEQAHGDENTVLPDDLARPAHWTHEELADDGGDPPA